MKKNITIFDIAKMAGVSKTTVSRYFNGGYVKKETRELIDKIVKDTNYTPNNFARLKAKRSKIVGVIAPRLDSIATSRVLMAIDSYFSKEGIRTFIINTNQSITEELLALETLNRMNVDGIIFSATQISEQHQALIESFNTPVVVIGQEYPIHNIRNDDYGAGKHIAQKVLEYSYQNALILTVNPQDKAVGVDRLRGIVEVFSKSDINFQILESDFSFESTYAKLGYHLKSNKADIIICISTQQLLAAYKIINEFHYHIPSQVGLCGFGGFEFVSILSPTINTIQFDYYEVGKKAAKMLWDILNDQPVSNSVMPYHYVKGESLK